MSHGTSPVGDSTTTDTPQWAIDAAKESMSVHSLDMMAGTVEQCAAIIASHAPTSTLLKDSVLDQLADLADHDRRRIAELEAENARLREALKQCETANGAFCTSKPSVKSMNRRLDEINSIVFAAVIQQQR